MNRIVATSVLMLGIALSCLASPTGGRATAAAPNARVVVVKKVVKKKHHRKHHHRKVVNRARR
jgi:hypothetical protein